MRIAALLVLCGYLALVAWLVLRPRAVLWVPPANLELLASIRADLARGPGHAARTIGADLLLLAPLGVLLPLLGRRLGGSRLASFTRTVLAGALIALVTGLARLSVPSQVADVDALLLHTLGVALTHLSLYGLLRSRALRPERPRPPAHRVAPRRRTFSSRSPQGGTRRSSGVGIAPGTDALHRSLPVR